MNRRCSEPDWKAYREVSELAIDRFAQRALDDIARLGADGSLTPWDCLQQIESRARTCNSVIHRDFSELSRSRVLMQLVAMHSHDLLEPDEIARFSEEIQETLRQFPG